MGNFLPGLWENLAANVLAAFLGVIAAWFVRYVWERWRYGRWFAYIYRGAELVLERRISPQKVKQILDEPAELSVFLKGLISPYDKLNCDIIETKKHPGLLLIDYEQRHFVIDLAKNPSSDAARGVTL